MEQLDGIRLGALKGVAAHDAAKGAALGQLGDFLEHIVGALGLTAAEDDDAAAIEGAANDFLYAVGKGLDGDARLFEGRAASFTSRCFWAASP